MYYFSYFFFFHFLFLVLGINDGAAAVLLVSESVVKQQNLKPLARIVGFAEVGVDPLCMGIGPIGAVTKLVSFTNIVTLFNRKVSFFHTLP